MAIHCEGCDRHAGVLSCPRCGALLCNRCYGPPPAEVCEACIADGDEPDELWPCVEDVIVRSAVL